MVKHDCEHPELISGIREHLKDLPKREARLARIEILLAISIILHTGSLTGAAPKLEQALKFVQEKCTKIIPDALAGSLL